MVEDIVGSLGGVEGEDELAVTSGRVKFGLGTFEMVGRYVGFCCSRTVVLIVPCLICCILLGRSLYIDAPVKHGI